MAWSIFFFRASSSFCWFAEWYSLGVNMTLPLMKSMSPSRSCERATLLAAQSNKSTGISDRRDERSHFSGRASRIASSTATIVDPRLLCLNIKRLPGLGEWHWISCVPYVSASRSSADCSESLWISCLALQFNVSINPWLVASTSASRMLRSSRFGISVLPSRL